MVQKAGISNEGAIAIKNIAENTTKIGRAPELILEILDDGMEILTDITNLIQNGNWNKIEMIGQRAYRNFLVAPNDLINEYWPQDRLVKKKTKM